VGYHPDVHNILLEYRLLSGNAVDEDARTFLDLTKKLSGDKCCVHKSPTDSQGLALGLETMPENVYVMIIRDPRDVITSHFRSTMSWTKVGGNETVEGILRKCRIYWEGYEKAIEEGDVFLTKYEYLHEDPIYELEQIWKRAGLDNTWMCLMTTAEESVKANAFPHPGVEERGMHRRLGIVGNFKDHLSTDDLEPLYTDPWWMAWMEEQGYECV
jgi:hypothetical protein